MTADPRLGQLIVDATSKGDPQQVLIPHRHELGEGHHWHAGAVVKRTHVPFLGDYLTVVVSGRRESPLPEQHPREEGRWLSVVTVRARDAITLDPPDAAISNLVRTVAADYRRTARVRTITNPHIQQAIDATGPIQRWAHTLTDATAAAGVARRHDEIAGAGVA